MKIEEMEKLCAEPGVVIDGVQYNVVKMKFLARLIVVAKAAKNFTLHLSNFNAADVMTAVKELEKQE